MTITLNGLPFDLPDAWSIADILAGRESRGLAVAVNDAVVPRGQHATHVLVDGDRVEIVTAVQGG
ncbi:sulfur carrier protein ThiS [Nocardioides pacificus]